MATSAKHFVLLFLLALLSFNFTQARQSQFFSKVVTTAPTVTSSTNAKDTVVQVSDNGLQNQPNFIQDSQTGYGLYDHGTGQLPPEDSDTSKTPTSFPYTAADVQPDTFRKERLTGTSLMDQGYPTTTYNNDETYMTNTEGYNNEQQELSGTSLMDRRSPTAYNNQAYVTKEDEYGTSNNNNKYEYANGQQGFSGANMMDTKNYNNNDEYLNQQQGFSGTSLMNRHSPTAYYNNQVYMTKPDNYDSTSNSNNYNYNYNNGVNKYNSEQQQEVSGDEKYLGAYNNNKNTNYYNSVNKAGYNVQQQGMSDTRFMENGKYYYDVKKEYNYNPNGLDHSSNYNGYSGSNINGNSQNQDSFNP